MAGAMRGTELAYGCYAMHGTEPACGGMQPAWKLASHTVKLNRHQVLRLRGSERAKGCKERVQGKGARK
eukprot:2991325-Rhodomonas_salina.1